MSSGRRILYFSGTRADFGLMENALRAIHTSPQLDLGIVVTGMHLDPRHGETIDDIKASGLPIAARVDIEHGQSGGALMARNVGRMMIGFADAIVAWQPDIVLLLGDRGEMLAAAAAALHLNIPIAHIHGGERSGTIDEPMRHAVSKLAHLHLVATADSRERLIRMGEREDLVLVTGAPGLDGLKQLALTSRADLFATHGLDPGRGLAMLVYHPVVQEAASSGKEALAILAALQHHHLQVLAIRPNSDAGSAGIVDVLDAAARDGRIRLVTHLKRRDYAALLSQADVLVGNSSSGIIEAASFGTPVVNIGSRQNFRERNDNVIDAIPEADAIVSALEAALVHGRYQSQNRYGDGKSAQRIVAALEGLDLNAPTLLMKTNAY